MRQLILALLASGAGHGYDLKRAYEQNYGSVWSPINDGQIYVTLSRLEKEGLVAHERREQESRPDRKEFTITDSGRAVLADWLNEKASPPNVRSETMLRILAAAASGLVDHRALIHSAQAEYRGALRRVEELREQADDPIRSLLVESASLQLDADLRWLEIAESQLRSFVPAAGSTRSSGASGSSSGASSGALTSSSGAGAGDGR
jgi:DNA-binding PadR family transcriptional regulator